MQDSIKLTRQQLYDLVWQKAISRLVVEDFAISGVGLAKVCKRHGIPTPPRGYWAQHVAGDAPRRPKLLAGNYATMIQLPRARSEEAEPELALAITEEKAPESRIEVPDRLHAPCALVAQAKVALEDAQTDAHGLVQSAENGLALRASRQALPRALRIADTWVKALCERGWQVDTVGWFSHADFGGVRIRFSIEENLVTEQRELPPDLGGSYAFHHRRQETVRKPSGRFTLALDEEPRLWSQMRRKWHDSEKRSLDEQLNAAVVGMLRIAAAVRAEVVRREEAEREEMERTRQAQLALEEQKKLRAQLAAEKRRVEKLRKQTASWRESEHIRQFVAHARTLGEVRALGLRDESLEQWGEWALRQADRMDPFAESPRSILDDEERIEKMCEHLLTWHR